MAIKAILFDDPECGTLCDDAFEDLKELTGEGEIERMDLTEGIKKYDLGNPEGTPVLAFISEATGKCINKIYFQDEDGKIALQKYPSVIETKIEPSQAESEG